MKSSTLYILAGTVAVLCVAECRAQNTYGYSEIYHDAARNVMVAYGGTDPDYMTSYYYRANIQTEVVLNNAMYSYRTGASDPYRAQLYFEFPAGPGQEWNMQSYHSVDVVYYMYQVNPGCSWDCYNWYDGYGYGALSPTQCRTTPIPGGWRLDCDYDDRYWYPPLITVTAVATTINLGNTSKRATTPGGYVPEFRVSADAFIPFPSVPGPATDRCYRDGTYWQLFYHGDNRGYQANSSSWRTYSWAQAAPALGIVRDGNTATGVTLNFTADSLDAAGNIYSWAWDWVLWDCKWMHGRGQATNANMYRTGYSLPGTNRMRVVFWGAGANPLVASLDIDWQYNIDLDASNPIAPNYTINYWHDCFPGHEAYINAQQIHGYLPSNKDFLTISSCLGNLGRISGGPRTDRIY